MGIDLGVWRGSIVMQQKSVVRLLPVIERVNALFGEDGEIAAMERTKMDSQRNVQGKLLMN